MKRPRKNNSNDLDKYLLDRFSKEDINSWSAALKNIRQLEYDLYYNLESQRKANYTELLAALRNQNGLSLNIENWYRVVDFKYSDKPLSAEGSTIIGGRFNYGGDIDSTSFTPFPALYIAQGSETALCEKFGVTTKKKGGLEIEELALSSKKSLSKVELKGRITNIFSLLTANSLNDFSKIISNFEINDSIRKKAKEFKYPIPKLITTPSALKESFLVSDWRKRQALLDLPANSQIFGKIVYDTGFEGILYPSTKGKERCLALFPVNFKNSDSYIELVETRDDFPSIKRLDASSWHKLV